MGTQTKKLPKNILVFSSLAKSAMNGCLVSVFFSLVLGSSVRASGRHSRNCLEEYQGVVIKFSIIQWNFSKCARICFHFFPKTMMQCIQAKISKTLDKRSTLILQQIAQNKNRAHPKDTTLPRIYEVERQHTSFLFYLAKPQSGGHLWCALRHCMSEPFDSRRFVEACPAYGAYTVYPALPRCRCSADVLRADHDRRLIAMAAWLSGTRYSACPSSTCLIFSTSQNAATAFVFKHNKNIDVTDLSWQKTICYRI